MEDNNFVRNVGKQDILGKIIFTVLFIVTTLVPVLFLPVSFLPIQFSTSLLFAIGVSISVLIYAVSAIVYGNLALPEYSKYILPFIFITPIVYLLAGIANGFSRMSFLGYTLDGGTVGFMLLGFVYMFLVSIFFREEKRIYYSYYAIVIPFLILSAFLIIRIFTGPEFLSFGLFSSLTSTVVGSWNSVGIFFGMCSILSLLAYELTEMSRAKKTFVLLGLLISLFFIALVNFKILWIVLSVVTFLYILFKMFSFEGGAPQYSFISKLKKVPLLTGIVFAVSVVFIVFSSSVGGYLAQKFNAANVEVRPSFTATFQIAKNTLSNHPLFGSGPNTFINEWIVWKPTEVVSSNLWNIDFTAGVGLIPTFIVTTGIVGILSWLLFFGFFIYLGVKSIFLRYDDAFKKYFVTSSFFTSLFLWAMSTVYVPSVVIIILNFFFTGIFFSSLYYSGILTVNNKNISLTPKKGFLSTLFFVVIIAGIIGLNFELYKSTKSLWYFQKSSYALNTSGDILASEGYMMKAIETVPLDIYYRALAEIEMLKINAVLNQDINQVAVETIQEQFRVALSQAITAGIEAKNSNPDNYLNWIMLGNVYGSVANPQLKVEGAYDSAINAFNEALRLNPNNPSINLLFARLAVTAGNFTKAKEYALQALEKKNNYLDAYYMLSQIEAENNNLVGAIDSATAATIIDPTNSALFFQLGLLKYNARDYEGAIEALEKAIEITPEYANAKYFLGISYDRDGQRESATKQFEELLATNPDNEIVIKVLENLRSNKAALTGIEDPNSQTGGNLPVNENVQ